MRPGGGRPEADLEATGLTQVREPGDLDWGRGHGEERAGVHDISLSEFSGFGEEERDGEIRRTHLGFQLRQVCGGRYTIRL